MRIELLCSVVSTLVACLPITALAENSPTFTVQEQASCNITCRNAHAGQYDTADLQRKDDKTHCVCKASGAPIAIYSLTGGKSYQLWPTKGEPPAPAKTASAWSGSNSSNAGSTALLNTDAPRCPECNCYGGGGGDGGCNSGALTVIAVGVSVIAGILAGTLIYSVSQ
jgi:hypothetical protein